MVTYEVCVELTDADLVPAFETYMRDKHIPEIFATGCFVHVHFDVDQSNPQRYRTAYHAASQADLDRYMHEHGPAFRADFIAHFPSGVQPARSLWTQQQVWQQQA